MTAQEEWATEVAAPDVSRLRVCYGECDPQGVVFNPTYLAHFDVGVTNLFRGAFGNSPAIVNGGVDLVVAEARPRYHRTVRFDEKLELEDVLARVGMLRHGLIDLGRLLARERDTKSAVPDWMRDQPSPYTEPTRGASCAA
jgi:YbgC/YbaW family acyl-CoA thioester hydrolase